MSLSLKTQILESIDMLRAWRADMHAFGHKVGFVPTMGALHAGHMALIEQAVKDCDQVVVSIFVNPLQFGASEDLNKYPRPFEADVQLCQKAGVQAVFHPSVSDMYGEGKQKTTVIKPPDELTERLCGLFRPGHFIGMATVVAKLFALTQPNIAYFGEKDYQQLAVIKRMVSDLNMPITIYGAPTVRESDGLAMSSRNVYLSSEQRKFAPVIYQTLCFIKDEVISNKLPLKQALQKGREKLSKVPDLTIQYLEVCDPDTLQSLNEYRGNMVVLVAAMLGNIRLIDNLVVRSDR